MDANKLAECTKLIGCAMLECLGHPHECWQKREWNVGDPMRGVGDLVATVTHYTGIAKVAEYLYPKTETNPKGCGCHGDDGRQGSMNAAFPFKETT